jgi:hypothetical protein
MSDQTITSLIEKLEGAEVGSRELDCAIWTATGGWDHVGRPPTFSTSLDAALALAERMLPGWDWQIVKGSEEEAYVALQPHGAAFGHEVQAATPALALCAAILRAKQ